MEERVLSTLPGSSEQERLQVMLLQPEGESSRLELRQQSFAPGLGWFTQSTVRLEPHQVAALRQALGVGTQQSPGANLPRAFQTVRTTTWQPRVVSADSA